MKKEKKEKLVIAGPCALESKQQLREVALMLKALGVNHIRASLWKPRTSPGWEGTGAIGLSTLLEETLAYGLVPASEILSAEHAQLAVQALQRYGEEQAKMVLWLGARNQNHLEQKKIAKILASGPKAVLLMFKNPMWEDERHWMGIAEHLYSAGFPMERLMVCHRGFYPGKQANPIGLRNLPDFEMAMRVKAKSGLPMLLDPSHIGGSSQNVISICQEASQYDFDGYMVEVHTNPSVAKTDAKQQLTLAEFEQVLKIIREEAVLETTTKCSMQQMAF
ncbi:MAG: hypothetical protein HQK50_11235, partial [Oligoflexia bacterium]|nr:hypothetical protein [Oligoflexia bacterium]MBF0366137.1 hypothetical protein [Oligoflexia bacterium]